MDQPHPRKCLYPLVHNPRHKNQVGLQQNNPEQLQHPNRIRIRHAGDDEEVKAWSQSNHLLLLDHGLWVLWHDKEIESSSYKFFCKI